MTHISRTYQRQQAVAAGLTRKVRKKSSRPSVPLWWGWQLGRTSKTHTIHSCRLLWTVRKLAVPREPSAPPTSSSTFCFFCSVEIRILFYCIGPSCQLINAVTPQDANDRAHSCVLLFVTGWQCDSYVLLLKTMFYPNDDNIGVLLCIAQIPLGSSCLDTTRLDTFDVSSPCILAVSSLSTHSTRRAQLNRHVRACRTCRQARHVRHDERDRRDSQLCCVICIKLWYLSYSLIY